MATSRNISGLNKLPDCFRVAPDTLVRREERQKRKGRSGSEKQKQTPD
ncbi:MAG: hypothetical protein LBT50_00630 [Prevotellaceae bacterium]|nr:hypothetical protein [Prevotellaceae bacterium]